MATGLLEFSTRAEFDAWHAQVNADLGYPNAATKTDRYTDVITGRDGKRIAGINNAVRAQRLSGRTVHDPRTYTNLPDPEGG